MEDVRGEKCRIAQAKILSNNKKCLFISNNISWVTRKRLLKAFVWRTEAVKQTKNFFEEENTMSCDRV